MIKEIIKQWENNKDKLADKIKNTNQSGLSYKWFVENIARIIMGINDPRIHEVDDGDYQGTLVYLFVNNDIYQPGINDYYITSVEYGSCSGCDTLEGIREYESCLPNDEQVKEYMTLCLHLVQKIKRANDNGAELIKKVDDTINTLTNKINQPEKIHVLKKLMGDEIVVDANIIKEMFNSFAEVIMKGDCKEVLPENILKLSIYSYRKGIIDTLKKIDNDTPFV